MDQSTLTGLLLAKSQFYDQLWCLRQFIYLTLEFQGRRIHFKSEHSDRRATSCKLDLEVKSRCLGYVIYQNMGSRGLIFEVTILD